MSIAYNVEKARIFTAQFAADIYYETCHLFSGEGSKKNLKAKYLPNNVYYNNNSNIKCLYSAVSS